MDVRQGIVRKPTFDVTMDELADTDRTASSQGREEGERWGAVSRRALLKAGWSVPVIMTVAPAVAFAASGTASSATSPAGGTNPTVQPSNTSSGSPSTGNATPVSGTPAVSGTGAGSGGPTEQPNVGPEPARINRGFTG